MLKNFLSFVFELFKIVIISLIIIIPVRYFLIQPFYVKGASMEPNFFDKEYLIVNEISYHFNNPQRGDVIVFRYPGNPQEYYIKRVIGLPGEKVQIKDGKVMIYNDKYPDGKVLNENYLEEGVSTNGSSEEVISLKDEEYFVLGDNRQFSKDSRYFGPVNRSYIIGKVLLRGLPVDKITVFESYQYNNF